MPNPVGSGVISFGLVSIPVRLYSAISEKGVAFHFLHTKCGSRIRTQRFCPTCNQVVERGDLVRGYEFAKDQYVQFIDAELESLEMEENRSIDLSEFLPLKAVDPVYFENAYFLGPDKGGEKAYQLLAQAMAQTEQVAIAQYASRGKGYLALIRPFKDGLILHTLYFADEVRSFQDIDKAAAPKLSEEEIEMSMRLVEQESNDKVQLDKYQDEHRLRVLKLVDAKVKGEQVEVTPPPQPRGQVVDLMEALKRSLGDRRGARAKPQPANRSEASDRRLEKVVSFADFKSALGAGGLKPNEQSLRKSYQALDKLRKARNLSWTDVQKKLEQFQEDFRASRSMSGMRRLRAARIPLTERDWERIGSA